MDAEPLMIFQATTEAGLLRAVVRSLLWPYFLGIGAVDLLIAFVLLRTGHQDDVIVPLGGFVIVLPYVWRIAANVVARQSSRVGVATAYRVEQTGITIAAGFSTRTIPWSQVTRVRRWRGQIAVYLGWRQIVGIPTGSLTAPEQARLLSILRSRGTAVEDRRTAAA